MKMLHREFVRAICTSHKTHVRPANQDTESFDVVLGFFDATKLCWHADGNTSPYFHCTDFHSVLCRNNNIFMKSLKDNYNLVKIESFRSQNTSSLSMVPICTNIHWLLFVISVCNDINRNDLLGH